MRGMCLLILLITMQLLVAGQGTINRILSIPVQRNGIQLAQPWTGGLNAPQFSPCDLNRDGLSDLFVFDRAGNKVLTFINKGGSQNIFRYAPEYEELFPEELTDWVLLRDYNYDGIPDIFTHANLGIKVYKGSILSGKLHFNLVSELLEYTDGMFNTNVWVTVTDIPVITDVNNDGDLDILSYGLFGSTVAYFEGQTKEHPGDIHYAFDSLKFYSDDQCWGKFAESSNDYSITMNISCKGSGEAPQATSGQRHVGSTIYDFDAGNDGDVDLLIGDVSYNNLIFVENCGDSTYAEVCRWDSAYPKCNTPVNLPVFPAAYGIDADNDGLQDLLVAPNADKQAQDIHNVWFYKNTNNTACNFAYQSDSFLVNHMLDFGSDSKGYFVDFNGDSLTDIIVASNYYNLFNDTITAVIAIYLNTGTATAPRFTKMTDNYNLFSNYNLVAVHPAFGDLDGDGKQDMLLGELNGYLHLCKNTGIGDSMVFPNISAPQYFNINTGYYSTPFIFDVNGDSLNDIVVGKKDGTLNYYRNFGTKTNAVFHKDSVNKAFGKVDVTLAGYNEGHSTPYINKDSAGNIILYAGSLRGTVFKYMVNTDSLSGGSFALIDSNFLGYDAGNKSTFAMADLNNDARLEYLSGNSRGGLLIFSETVWPVDTTLSVTDIMNPAGNLTVFPNPAGAYVQCSIPGKDFKNPKLALYNVLGEQVWVEQSVFKNHIRLNTAALNSGFYVVRVTDDDKMYSAKILLR